MTGLPHSWKLIVFIGAILLPSAALVLVSQRTIEQNRELAGKHRLDDQRAAKDRIARELLARLEAMKSAASANPDAPPDPQVALVSRVQSGRLSLPWEMDPASRGFREHTAKPPAFASALVRGEQAEFAGRNLAGAAAGYREALRSAADPLQAAYARLLLAGVLQKQGRAAESLAEARRVVQAPIEFVDEDGIPFSVQAAALLPRSKEDLPAIRRALELATRSRRWPSPIAVAHLSNLAGQLQQAETPEHAGWIAEFRDRLTGFVRLEEQVQSLQDDAARLGLLRPARNPAWIYYPGAEPWLVSTHFSDGRPVVLIGVRTQGLFGPFEAAGNLRFLGSTEAGGELLADAFPGLKVRFAAAGADAGGTGAPRWIYYLALFVLVGGTAFGASLLWRSLRREMELAQTRAQFVASVSHELKTPLTAIRMYAETLEMGRSLDANAQKEYLETISNECDRLSRLADNVLLFSKLEQGKNVYRFRSTSLADVVRRAAQALAYPLSQYGFELRMDIDEGLPPVNADPDAIEQAVLNLLTNAMKYSAGTKEIELALGRRGIETVIRVTDHGHGIAAENLGKIFEKYYRAPTPENQSIPGTGLGLTVVAQIAKAHGGRVEVESAPGKGSTFRMKLPIGNEA